MYNRFTTFAGASAWCSFAAVAAEAVFKSAAAALVAAAAVIEAS